ncbi:flagellar biosynthetic protein FliO [Demequina sp. TTPB684]|uniref:flagellar biosynthetic protein FliO n=1 Tax=unclassified Demequina TaxID=2620311 RepID=UPI001CF4E6A0|nr:MULTISPECIES: flagellar biosynthetic protein FliO [unclassified Demequina]MCB2412892.1 flagellar biosynthetic protein FliO [Demequina sp. TTPB684]UPU87882.1 flagellar biosynthetic protein FliO [Demequina sp. TMPB413]
METLILVARVGLSLAAVLGLLWWFSRRMQSSTTLRRRRREELVVLGRQQLGGKAGVALIEASGRRLVIGYGEHGVSLLHDAGEVAAPEPEDTADASDLDNELLTLTTEGGPAEQLSAPVKARNDASVPARSTSARTADARRPRTPLEGSILSPGTWRQAVVAAQEWTTRRS